MSQPLPGEYPPFAENYVALAAGYSDVVKLLNDLKGSTYKTFTAMSEEKGDYAYAPGKWTVKQMLEHIIDTERIFAYRLYCISHGDKTAFPGFDQNDYVANSNAGNRTLKNIAEEFKAVREANMFFINNLSEGQMIITGTASNHPVSVRALLYMMAGHELHHLNLLKERYAN